MGAEISSRDNYLDDDKRKQSTYQPRSHSLTSFVYRCVTKLSQIGSWVHCALFFKV